MDLSSFRDKFLSQGYVLVPRVLSSDAVQQLNSQVDLLLQSEKTEAAGAHRVFQDVVSGDARFRALCSNPIVLPLVAAIMGPNIHLTYSDLLITGAEGESTSATRKAGFDVATGMGVHRDSARVNDDLGDSLDYMISLKAAFWLSDVSHDDRGNLALFPGSHIDKSISAASHPHVPVLAQAGDVLLFDRRILHGRTTNRSAFERRVLFLEYGYRWLRRKCSFKLWSSGPFSGTDVERQLLWQEEEPWGYYFPTSTLPLEQPLTSTATPS